MGLTKAERQRRAEAQARNEREAAARRAASLAEKEAEARARELAELPRRVHDLRRALELLDSLGALLDELSCLTECPIPLEGVIDLPESVPLDALCPSSLAGTIAEQLATAERRLAQP